MQGQYQAIEVINQPLIFNENSSLQEYVASINNLYPNRSYNKENDLNQLKYIGWNQQIESNASCSSFSRVLFSDRTIQVIQQKTSQQLQSMMNENIVPSNRIVMQSLQTVFENFSPLQEGDMYGKYTVVDQSKRNDYSDIVNRTISMLVQGISNQLLMEKNNNNLSIWDTVLGDFNKHGMRSHSAIKLREKRPDPMLFHMKY